MPEAERARWSWKTLAANLAWPIVSLASVAWSIHLLQIKLWNEASADPVVKTMLDDGTLSDGVRLIADAIFERLADVPAGGYVLAGLATLVAYVALAWYDRIALIHLGRLKGISWLYVGAASFVAYALGHNIGASVFSGGMVRLRAYTAKGLSKSDVAVLVTLSSFTFALGTALMLGLVLLTQPQIARH